MPNGHHPHIRWRRLNFAEARGRRETPQRPPGPPLRPQQAQHGATLQTQTDLAFEEVQRRRRLIGIDPSRLLLLEMCLLQNAEREHLERLGLQVVDEAEARVPIEQPYYALTLAFDDQVALRYFATSAELPGLGVSGTSRHRASNGSAHQTRLEVRFADRPAAIAFRDRADLPERFRFVATTASPQRVASRLTYRLVIQFPDQGAIDAFRREEAAYSQQRGGQLGLPAGQRNELFDALEGVRALGPDDRQGERLRTGGPPEVESFFLDVDLWHPGTTHQVAQVIREFREMVPRTGDRSPTGQHPSPRRSCLLASGPPARRSKQS